MDLLTATPVEIDTVFAKLYDEQHSLRSQAVMLADRIMSAANLHYPREQVSRHSTSTPGTLDEALAIVAQKATAAYGNAYYATMLVNREDVMRGLQKNLAEQAPLQAEFDRRGGWSRAYLVLNTGGHVHTSLYCGTCFPSTQYGWLVELSGSDEAAIVAAIGSDACTVCYPTAPVVKRARTVFHHTEIAEQAARAERQAAKDARAAAKAAKAITLAGSGTPLRVFNYRTNERVQQMRDGSTRVTPAHDVFETIETLAAAKMWLTNTFDGYSRTDADKDAVAEAIAYKLGTSAEVELQNAAKRASKRRR